MTRVLWIALLVGCGTDTIHDQVTCGPEWGDRAGQVCESACEPKPATSAKTCTAILPGGDAYTCEATFDVVDIRGCCTELDDAMIFVECTPDPS